MHRIVPAVVAALGLALIAPAASGAAPSCPNPQKADADNFNRDGGDNGANVTNPYFPLKVGTTLIYKGTEGGEPVEDRFAVTGTTKSFTPPGGGTIKAREVRDQVTPGTSALFLMTSNVVQDKVLDEFRGTGAHLVSTNLTKEQEDRLREVFVEEDA